MVGCPGAAILAPAGHASERNRRIRARMNLAVPGKGKDQRSQAEHDSDSEAESHGEADSHGEAESMTPNPTILQSRLLKSTIRWMRRRALVLLCACIVPLLLPAQRNGTEQRDWLQRDSWHRPPEVLDTLNVTS